MFHHVGATTFCCTHIPIINSSVRIPVTGILHVPRTLDKAIIDYRDSFFVSCGMINTVYITIHGHKFINGVS